MCFYEKIGTEVQCTVVYVNTLLIWVFFHCIAALHRSSSRKQLDWSFFSYFTTMFWIWKKPEHRIKNKNRKNAPESSVRPVWQRFHRNTVRGFALSFPWRETEKAASCAATWSGTRRLLIVLGGCSVNVTAARTQRHVFWFWFSRPYRQNSFLLFNNWTDFPFCVSELSAFFLLCGSFPYSQNNSFMHRALYLIR